MGVCLELMRSHQSPCDQDIKQQHNNALWGGLSPHHLLLPLSSALHWYPLLLASCFSRVLLSFSFFSPLALNQRALFSSSCHCCTLSLSGDPFDVVRRDEIPPHLGQFSVWRLILSMNLFLELPNTPLNTSTRSDSLTVCIHTLTYSSANPPPIKENETKYGCWESNTHSCIHKEDIFIFAHLPCRQGMRRKASWLWSARSRIICWDGGSGQFGCVDN